MIVKRFIDIKILSINLIVLKNYKSCLESIKNIGSFYFAEKEKIKMIIRVKKDKNYAVMSNYHFKDKALSLRAKGLLSLMLSLPDN